VLNERLARDWGTLGQSSTEKQHEIEKLTQLYQSAPLWAYEQQKGAAHFQKHCATCHNPDEKGIRIGPNLAGTGSKGIRYIVENVIDPSAVIGRDFQARNIVVNDGRVITGLIESETDTAATIRTATNSVTVAKEEIEEIVVSDKSFMPEGLFSTLTELERIELLKYLMAL
jgi:putative heme-binding domain-containing protein